MTRSLPVLSFLLLFSVACASSKAPAPAAFVDPTTDPTAIGAVDEGVREGAIEGEAAARTGRRIGRVAGVVAAVLGGPERESVDDAIDRYRRTRDAVEATSALIGAADGANKGAKRGFDFDVEFSELQKIAGLEVTRPFPDEIEVRFAGRPTDEQLAALTAVFAAHETRLIDIEGAGDAAFDLRDALIERGMAGENLEAHRDPRLHDLMLRAGYRD